MNSTVDYDTTNDTFRKKDVHLYYSICFLKQELYSLADLNIQTWNMLLHNFEYQINVHYVYGNFFGIAKLTRTTFN